MSRIFDKIRDEHTTEIIPATPNIRLKKGVQQPLWGLENSAGVRMGLFYELITAGLFGGELLDSLVRSTESAYGAVKPDVLDKRRKTVFESKANRMGHQFNLAFEQVQRYHIFMIRHPQYRISFAIWRHGFKAIRTTNKNFVELFAALSKVTYAGLVLPFSLILQLHKNPLLKIYENGPWIDCTRINSTVTNGFIIDPMATIKKYGADPEDYIYTRYILKNGFYVDGHKINSFPLTYIKDKNYETWRACFLNTPPF